jgi:hypothetical protein
VLKVLIAAAVAALAAVPAALGAPPPQLAVPAAIAAAHPDGQQVFPQVIAVAPIASPSAAERINCWRSYFTGDNGGIWGTEQEHVNPYWCGNGSTMRGADSSWHYQSCSLLVSCLGETGVGTWYGCPNGCPSLGQQITGHFKVNAGIQLTVDETVVYEVYPNGQSWYYAYHN